MHPGRLYKVKHHSGRILGPLDLERIRKLVQKNEITGKELAKEYPNGSWQDINRIDEIAEILLSHASGNLNVTGQTLKSEQSSYRPILGQTQVQIAPTLVLPPVVSETPTVVLTDGGEAPSEPSTAPEPDPVPAEPEKEEELSKTIRVKPSRRKSKRSRKKKSEEPEQLPESFELMDLGASPSHPSKDPHARKQAQEETIALKRPGLQPAKKGLRIPKGGELIRVILIASALGYFGYDTFLKDENESTSQFLKRAAEFRPSLPKTTNAPADPKRSAALYEEGMKTFVLDHVQGYKAAARYFSEAVTADPENLKAAAMLATAYVNLIDTSTKDETFFAVISQLIDRAKAKGIELPEVIIAEVEFLTVTGRADASIQRIVEYTKTHENFDPSMFVYLSEAFLAKGDATSASKYMADFPDNKAWTPRIFFLRGRIAEELGDIPGAIEQYNRALARWPSHSKSRLRKVYLVWKGGNISDSEKDLQIILKAENQDVLSPRDLAQANYLLSQYFSVRQNYEAALHAVDRALALDRGNRDYLLEYYTLLAREGGNVGTAKNEARMYFFLREGEVFLKQGLTNEALAQFLNARTENPKSFAPLVKIGDMFLQLNDLLNARLNYQKAAEMAPNNIEVWSKYISVLIQSYEWDEAQKAMDKFRKFPVGQSSIDKAAGDLYAKQGRYQEAAVFYKKAMSRESIDPDVYIAYGKILIAVKSFKDAPFFFALSRRFDPLNPEPVILTAKAVAEVEGLDFGIQYLQNELQKGALARAELLAAIAELQIRKGQWSAAQQYIDQARQANPDYAYPWKLQAQVYLNDENTDKKALDRALEAFQSYSDRNASDPSGYLERYRIFSKKAQFEKAEKELHRIFAIYPKYPNIHYYKGLLYSNMGNFKVAAEEYASELTNNPRSAPTLIALGKALLELGDAKQALTHLAVAMAIQPTNAESKMFAALANQKMKNYTGAIALFQTAVSLDPGNPILYKRMGECYREMGDQQGARAAFQKYLQMEPDAQDKAEIEGHL